MNKGQRPFEVDTRLKYDFFLRVVFERLLRIHPRNVHKPRQLDILPVGVIEKCLSVAFRSQIARTVFNGDTLKFFLQFLRKRF